jgi:sterol desaturase/sphingolipid hydroxylase (fatty acid hydroxylase superfamily)
MDRRHLTALNFSAIAVGALATLLTILFGGSLARNILLLPPEDAYKGILLALVVLLVFLTGTKSLVTIANFGIGVVGFALAYQFEVVQQTFVDGRVFFIGAFLIVIVAYGRRTRRFEL